MNLKTLVKISNVVAGISVLLLVYWVFIYVLTEVFGLRIFRENISQSFVMSVLGILALMAGSLMINVMFNLTRIAQRHNADPETGTGIVSRKVVWAFALSFPIIFGLLFAGDYITSVKKENLLVRSARTVIESNQQRTDQLINYSFSDQWLTDAAKTLSFFERTDANFPHTAVIVQDEVDGAKSFLAIRGYSTSRNDAGEVVLPAKSSYQMATTKPQRDYLDAVFSGKTTESRFTAAKGNYTLFYPYAKDGKVIVLYFSDYQQYGKMGK